MINNSSTDRWIRLESKSLDQQFLNEIIHGLNCSPFEASAVLDTVYNVFGSFFDSGASLKPGQIRLQISVVLTVNDDKEDLRVRKQDGVIGLRRHKILRVCQEAFDQGGLLTVEDLAYRLFNCGTKTICRDLAYFRKNDIFVPLRSTVKDVGRTLSHRLLIIKLWAQGKEYSEISLNACHSLSAVQNYVDKFKRTIALSKESYDINRISFLLRISTSLVEQYVNLYHKLDFAAHREKELSSFLKKSFISNNQEANS
jgi:hypothetical protein